MYCTSTTCLIEELLGGDDGLHREAVSYDHDDDEDTDHDGQGIVWCQDFNHCLGLAG